MKKPAKKSVAPLPAQTVRERQIYCLQMLSVYGLITDAERGRIYARMEKSQRAAAGAKS